MAYFAPVTLHGLSWNLTGYREAPLDLNRGDVMRGVINEMDTSIQELFEGLRPGVPIVPFSVT